jgi:hypothetical protein
VKREYARVVEAYRDRDGKTRHRTVINLGRRDVLAEHLDLGSLKRAACSFVIHSGSLSLRAARCPSSTSLSVPPALLASGCPCPGAVHSIFAA